MRLLLRLFMASKNHKILVIRMVSEEIYGFFYDFYGFILSDEPELFIQNADDTDDTDIRRFYYL
jgi:hypothetical protein